MLLISYYKKEKLAITIEIENLTFRVLYIVTFIITRVIALVKVATIAISL